jgi:hypothetical protein
VAGRAEAEYAAMDTLRDRILEERMAFVAKHRKRLVADAQGEAEQAHARYLKAIDELAQAREDLVGLRETTVWAALYPSDTLTTFVPSHALIGGRRRDVEQQLHPVWRGSCRHTACWPFSALTPTTAPPSARSNRQQKCRA